ncbi:TonB-dependent receptor domain-containing protein [Telmatobacter bradus]|uniref:TonB-dependent receptor domain-containing protein n=1 Tax=Telmatobacter bradus TaxID=474953 RepID=UPI003B42822E
MAQTGGQGALEGTVLDPGGAAVAHATVTAINQASGVASERTSSSAGVYEITPLIPGIYTITVTADGFETLKQENIEVNGMSITGYNAKLKLGAANETVTVTDTPPQLETTNATLGATVTHEVYESLPFIMNAQQRDATSYGTLAPGAQSGSRAPNFSGTGNYASEVYLDGIPTTTANMQSDNRPVSNSIAVESVDQMSIQTSGATAEYQGAGSMSFTTKSGGKEYHGSVSDFVRNRAFDTWGFTQPWATKVAVVNGVSTTVAAGKPQEHLNEISIALGGPLPKTKYTKSLSEKLFFFANWDEFHGRNSATPVLDTVPTTLMREGNFTELGTGSHVFNPFVNTCSGSTCSRSVFAYGGTTNVINPTYISPISQYEQSFMPSQSLSSTTLNYLASGISGYDNHSLVLKFDYDLTHSQRVSFVYTRGARHSIGYGSVLPKPYTVGVDSNVIPVNMIIEHQWVASSTIVNQLKYGFTRQGGGTYAPTAGGSWATDAGITGLPAGQASENFPCSSFSTSTYFTAVQTAWTECGASDASSKTVPNTFTLLDNLQWSKGKHLLTFGIQYQWLEDNVSAQITHSGVYTQTWSPLDTAQYSGTSLLTTGKTLATAYGYSYASFLLGAVHSASTSVPTYATLGGRYRPFAPYVQDDWKITPRLTMNLGLRWDFMPPYHEVNDRWSFFQPNWINAATGTYGSLEFAGNHGAGISCMCRTPVQTYWKNWGPRLGLAWQANDKTVVRAGFSVSYTHAGGVGGRAGAGTGASSLGFGSNIILPTAVTSGSSAGPSFYLNTSSGFSAAEGYTNSNFGGVGYSIPAALTPSASSLTLDTGNYVSSGSYVTPGSAPAYADPYLSGRAPEFEFFNFGIQRALTNKITLSINYAGSEGHFVDGATVPGFWSGYPDMNHVAALSPLYAADGTTHMMAAQATTANVASAMAADPSLAVATWYANAGNASTTPTIGRWTRPYPQYSSPPSAEWDNIANVNYNSLQITLAQRDWKGVTYTFNYTYSKNIGDDGTTRASWAVPASMSSNGKAMPGNNRADRDLTTTNEPQNLNLYGVANLPFGKGHIGGSNLFVRSIASDWKFAGIFTYHSGVPLLITGSTCNQYSVGTCMPDLVDGMRNKIRENGKWLKGVGGKNTAAKHYLNSAAFSTPNTITGTNAGSAAVPYTKIGDAPRTELSRVGLTYPSVYNINANLQRSFNLTRSGDAKFVFQADCFNVTNTVTPSTISAAWSSQDETLSTNTFGEVTAVTGNRDFQFSGRITF